MNEGKENIKQLLKENQNQAKACTLY